MCLCVCDQLLSHVQSFETTWTVSYKVPLSIGFPRQEDWSGLPFPSPGDLSDPRIELTSPALQGDFFFLLLSQEGSPYRYTYRCILYVYTNACVYQAKREVKDYSHLQMIL